MVLAVPGGPIKMKFSRINTAVSRLELVLEDHLRYPEPPDGLLQLSELRGPML
jgi:hypothetical protein